jgi:hypothetical protein
MYASSGILHVLARFADDYRRRRRRVRTERLLGELPPAILKDIGWPDSTEWNDRG